MGSREARHILHQVAKGAFVPTDKVLQAQHVVGEAAELDIVSMDDEEDDGDHDALGLDEGNSLLTDSKEVEGFQISKEP